MGAWRGSAQKVPLQNLAKGFSRLATSVIPGSLGEQGFREDVLGDFMLEGFDLKLWRGIILGFAQIQAFYRVQLICAWPDCYAMLRLCCLVLRLGTIRTRQRVALLRNSVNF